MDHQTAYKIIMSNLQMLDFTGDAVPSALVLTGNDSFPLVMNNKGQTLVAASQYGKGRMVVLSHESYLSDPRFAWFIENIIDWLKTTPNVVIGVQRGLNAIVDNLYYTGDEVVVNDCPSPSMGVFCCTGYDDSYADAIIAFVKNGGGLLIGGQAWYWSSANPDQDPYACFPGNKIISVGGIHFSPNKANVGVYPPPTEMPTNWLAVSDGKDHKADLEFLLKDVTDFNINSGATASQVMVHGPMAFPIAMDDENQAFLAGASYGRGRVIVTTHESLMSYKPLKTFLVNAFRWLDNGRNGVIGIQSNLKDIVDIIKDDGFQCTLTDFKSDLSVYCCTSYSDSNCSEIQEFVSEGGGLFMGGHAWYWSYSNRDKDTLTGYPGNKVLSKFGIGILSSTVKNSVYKAPDPSEHANNAYHFRKMLTKFAEHILENKPLADNEKSSLKKLGQDCSSFLQMKTEDNPSYSTIRQLVSDVVMTAGVPQVSKTCPIKDLKDNVLLKMGTELYNVVPNKEDLLKIIIKDRPDLPTEQNVTVAIDGNNEGQEAWRSTGLYLPYGKTTGILFPSSVIKSGWMVQVGCHTDNLNAADTLKRAPVVTQRIPVTSEIIQISNLWGGLIYIIVPQKSKLGQIYIMVQEAVRAPYYKMGETSVADWQQTIRHYPAPWGEVEFENIILTVRSEDLRNVEDPEKLGLLWNRLMKGITELAVIPPIFKRKERFVTDAQISHGWMHAGYPVMVHLESTGALINANDIDVNGTWGPIHELGHNQQQGKWEFPPHTTEATCNLWSVYVHETILNIPREKAHSALAPENRMKIIKEYLKKGAKLQHWEVFTALETYLQLQEGFGWEPFKKIFAEYQTMGNVSNDRDSKMNLYAETFAKTVNRNLTRFFRAWGWPITEEVANRMAAFPDWDENPMIKYTE